MRTIETTTVISQDRKLLLQLPADVEPGEHRVVVLRDEPEKISTAPEDVKAAPTRREGHVLVYNGEIVGPIETAIDDLREERARQILAGYQPCQVCSLPSATDP